MLSNGGAQQSRAGNGAIACFSSNFISSAQMLIARRSWKPAFGAKQ